MNRVIVFLATVCLMVSCQFDDPPEISTYDFLSGTWSLVNVKGGLAGIDDDFEEGVITWSFNAVNKTVNIENNNTGPALIDILPTGTYPFEIEEGEEQEQLIVDEMNLGIIECVDLGLVHVDQRVVDGVAITFAR